MHVKTNMCIVFFLKKEKHIIFKLLPKYQPKGKDSIMLNSIHTFKHSNVAQKRFENI